MHAIHASRCFKMKWGISFKPSAAVLVPTAVRRFSLPAVWGLKQRHMTTVFACWVVQSYLIWVFLCSRLLRCKIYSIFFTLLCRFAQKPFLQIFFESLSQILVELATAWHCAETELFCPLFWNGPKNNFVHRGQSFLIAVFLAHNRNWTLEANIVRLFGLRWFPFREFIGETSLCGRAELPLVNVSVSRKKE